MTSEESKADSDAAYSVLSPHIEDTVRAVAEMHAEHQRQASPVDRAIDRATAILGSVFFLGSLTLFVLLWVGINAILPLTGGTAFDPPPYPRLMSGLGLMALYMTILILTTQRRADRLASRREQMTLELSLLSERKTAKIVELLEELRRDSPDVKDRIDDEAKAMATPVDTRAVRDAITGIHEEMSGPEAVNNGREPSK
jgi:uncharacterized membrane protein